MWIYIARLRYRTSNAQTAKSYTEQTKRDLAQPYKASYTHHVQDN